MNTVDYLLIAVAGAFVIILTIVLIVVGIVRRDRLKYEPVPEKGNIFIYQKDESAQFKEDQIMMNARFYLRSTMYSLNDKINRFGSRIDKIYYSVNNNSVKATSAKVNDNERIMMMVPVSKNWPIPLHTEIGKNTFKSIIKSLEVHPFISVPLVIDYIVDKNLAVSIRPFYPKGSLRDFIHQSKPKMPYNDKYQTHFALSDKVISKLGRQILEALIFLKINKLPYYHLNTSNILIDDQNVLISDYENAFLGLKPRISKLLTPFADKMDLEILSFGAVLFEMACGFELESVEAFDVAVSSSCHPEVKKVLESIFKPWYGVPPTLEDLTKVNLFVGHKFKSLPNLPLQYTSREREMIEGANQLNLTFLSKNKTENISSNNLPSLKGLKKEKKRKSLAFTGTPIQLEDQSNQSSLSNSYTPFSSSANFNNQKRSTLSQSYSFSQPMNTSTTTPPSSTSNSYQPSTPTMSTISSPPPPPPTPNSSFKPSGGPPPPPPPPKSNGGPPPPPPPPPVSSGGGENRKGLLSSIENFSSAKLKKTVTKDKSGPKIGK